MSFHGFKMDDENLIEWLNSKKNKSQTIKEALKEKYEKELNVAEPKNTQIIRVQGKIKGIKI